MPPHKSALVLLLSLGIDYIRWTQLAPMFLMWGFGLLMLLALTFVNFQAQIAPALASFLEWLVQLPVIGPQVVPLLSGEHSDAHLKTGDFRSFILSAWATLSLLFMLTGALASALFGPFRPWTLKHKIRLAGAGAVALLTGMAANYYAAPKNFNGEAVGWILNFSLISLLVFIASVYCLSISHFLARLSKSLLAADRKTQTTPRPPGK